METVQKQEFHLRMVKGVEEVKALLDCLPRLVEEANQMTLGAQEVLREVEQLRGEVATLRAENETFRKEREAMADTFGKVMKEMHQLSTEMIERLRGASTKAPFARTTQPSAAVNLRQLSDRPSASSSY